MRMMDRSGDVSARTRWREAWGLAGLALVAVLVALVAALNDFATVTGREALGRVMFGYPLNWLAQNQTTLDPPFPATVSPASPWENPTSVAFGPLLVDVLAVYGLLLVGWFVGRSAFRDVRTSAP